MSKFEDIKSKFEDTLKIYNDYRAFKKKYTSEKLNEFMDDPEYKADKDRFNSDFNKHRMIKKLEGYANE